MRIAFTSCQDVIRDAEQNAWRTLAQQQPDHIVLLGDNIYMDYKFGPPHSPRPVREMALPEFSALMHGRYAAQWNVASFQQAVRAVGVQVHAIWDDHDFAWNNARGGSGDEDDEEYVSPDRRRLSRLLFEQYRQALKAKPPAYPPNPCPDGVVPVAQDLGGVQAMIRLSTNIHLHLLDGRSFRQSRGGFFKKLGKPRAHMLGELQRADVASALLPMPGINLLASGTTLKDWAKYVDLAWLQAQAATHRIVLLSGDVHHPVFSTKAGVVEMTASAIAQPPSVTKLFKRKTEVFGILDVNEATGQAEATFWHEGRVLMSQAV
ncbi:MAG: hypothetical protein EOP36_07030 [Rubrivivax sp.]|nr:MAG: hypothetical protein EOP36_07030 [Rubrivivax sp.]